MSLFLTQSGLIIRYSPSDYHDFSAVKGMWFIFTMRTKGHSLLCRCGIFSAWGILKFNTAKPKSSATKDIFNWILDNLKKSSMSSVHISSEHFSVVKSVFWNLNDIIIKDAISNACAHYHSSNYVAKFCSKLRREGFLNHISRSGGVQLDCSPKSMWLHFTEEALSAFKNFAVSCRKCTILPVHPSGFINDALLHQ